MLTISELRFNYNLGKRNFGRIRIIDGDLSGINLSKISIPDSDLRGVNFSGTDLSGANLSSSDLCVAFLCGANFTGANLCGSALRFAKIYNANFSDAKLSAVDFRDSVLERSKFDGADLHLATFYGADLRNSCLDHVSVTINMPSRLFFPAERVSILAVRGTGLVHINSEMYVLEELYGRFDQIMASEGYSGTDIESVLSFIVNTYL